MARVHIDHIALCVRDLERAIDDWREILGVLAPDHADWLTRGEGTSEGTPMVWATFQNPDPLGVSIQLWAPAEPGSWVDKVLDRRGEFVHHIAFLSEDLGHTLEECRDRGLPLLLEQASSPDTMPWLQWNFIGEEKAHGVLIELATRYLAAGESWYPHPGNRENEELREELRKQYER